jgi:hypothetical protein
MAARVLSAGICLDIFFDLTITQLHWSARRAVMREPSSWSVREQRKVRLLPGRAS